MKIEVVTTAGRLAELAPEWTALQDASDPPYYVRHHFVQAWWNAYQDAPGYELRILVVRNNGAVVGIAPFALAPRRRRGRQIMSLRFASHGDYMGLLVDESVVRADTVCRLVMQHLEQDSAWEVVSLGNIPSNTPFAHYLLKSMEYNNSFTLHVESPYINLDKYASFDMYTKALGLKRERKHCNRIRREVSPQFITVQGNECNILERMGRLHRVEKEYLQEQHARSERHSLYDDERRVELYRQVYDGAGETVTFAYESDDGELLSYKSCYVAGDRLLAWNTAYHPDLAEYSVGEIILYDILEKLFDERTIRTFDLGAGRYPWKFTWTDQFTATYRLILRRPSADSPPASAAPARVEKPVSKDPRPQPVAKRPATPKPAPQVNPAPRLLRRLRPKG